MSTSNIFSNVYIYGNCTVKGTLTTLGGSAVSQWTTSGSIIYYTTGNVGVGTAAPVSTFEVTGTGFPGTALTRTAASDNYGVGIQYSLISNTGSFRGYYARAFGGSLGTIATTNQNQANGYFGIDVANAGLFASDTAGYSGVQFYVAPSISVFNTRVGIGTTNPGSTLTVSGAGSFGSGYNAFTAPTGGLIVQGNVGIGTTNPGVNALQVTGNVVTSGFTSNSTNTVFNFDTLTIPFVNATQIGIGNTAPTALLDIRGGSISLGSYDSTSASRYVGYYNVNDASGPLVGMEIENTTLTGNYSQKLHFRTHWFGTNNGRRMTITEGGNVGIATTSPSSQIVYLSSGPNTDSFGQPVGSYFSNNSTNWISSCHGGNGVSKVVMGYLTGAATIAGHNSTLTAWAPLVLSGGGANVGVGSTNPQYGLDVLNDVNCTGSFRVNTILQPKLAVVASQTGMTSATIGPWDMVNFNCAEIRINWSRNGTSFGTMTFSFKDSAGNARGVSEPYTNTYQNTGGTTGSGGTATLASNSEVNGNAYGAVIRVWSNNTGGTGGRYSYEFVAVGCYASVGATRNYGSGYTTVASGTINQLVLTTSAGTFDYKSSVTCYV
jgi:hypothetical protein